MVQGIILTLLLWCVYFFIAVSITHGVLLLFSLMRIKEYLKEEDKTALVPSPGLSFLVPAYNEETLIVETIQTYLSLPQEKKEILVIDDGSHDQTMKLLQVMFQLKKSLDPSGRLWHSVTRPELRVVEAPHSGKAGALNLGLNFARYDLICTMDADTIPRAQGVEACLQSMARNPKLVAVGGVIQVLSHHELKNNSPLKARALEKLTSFQRVEYLRTFICERLGWSFLGSTILISGAFCMVKKEAIKAIGGFSPRSITEDFDLIVRLRSLYRGKNHDFSILPVTTCYTQVPRTLRHLSRQRMRWHMGLIQTLFQNSYTFLHPQHGCLGFIAIPYFWLVEAFSPLICLLGMSSLLFSLINGWLEISAVALFFTLGLIYNLGLNLAGLWIDKTYVSRKSEWSPLEGMRDSLLIHFGYKQLNLWWRLLTLMRMGSRRPIWGEKPRAELIHRGQ
jgi:cellulose synthase/poly-beta-1,6-N-acetylglucosamine synthase-like glycosyltransferase